MTFRFAANRKYALDTIVKLNLNLKQRSTILKAQKAEEADINLQQCLKCVFISLGAFHLSYILIESISNNFSEPTALLLQYCTLKHTLAHSSKCGKL